MIHYGLLNLDFWSVFLTKTRCKIGSTIFLIFNFQDIFQNLILYFEKNGAFLKDFANLKPKGFEFGDLYHGNLWKILGFETVCNDGTLAYEATSNLHCQPLHYLKLITVAKTHFDTNIFDILHWKEKWAKM